MDHKNAGHNKALAIPAQSFDAAREMDVLKVRIGKVIYHGWWILLVGLIVSIGLLYYIILNDRGETGKGAAYRYTIQKMALAASVQVAIGMSMGFISIFIGLMMTWLGVNAEYELSAKANEKGEFSLKSAAPGLLFFFGGGVLIWVSLYKPIVYTEPGAVIGWQQLDAEKKTDDQKHDSDGQNGKGPKLTGVPPITNAEK